MRAHDYKRIFILTHEGIGDLMLLLPTLHALKENSPDARIRMAISRLQRPLASTLEGTLVELAPAYIHGESLSHLKTLRDIRQFRPDLLFDFDGGLRFALCGKLSSAKRKIHPPSEFTKPYASAFHQEKLPYNGNGHRVETLMALLDLLGMKKGKISFEFDVPDRYRENAAKIAERHIPIGTIGLVPIAGQRTKNWPVASLQETIDILSRDLGRNVVILGRDTFPGLRNATDLGGRSDFLTDAYLLRYAGVFDVIAGVDTGMMQIAGSVSSDPNGRYEGVTGNRTVSLFGPTESAIYRPYDPTGSLNYVVKPMKRSQAMGLKGWAGDRFNREYMKELPAREIADTITKHLDAMRASLR
jgi:heptosyltransferase-1